MKKRLFAMFLALAMCLALLPTAALAADSDFVIDGTVLIKYQGNDSYVTIPAGVTAIGDSAFRWQSIKSVTIPDGVTSIGQAAFQFCSRLSNVTMSNSVTSIGPSAFSNCDALTDINIPNGISRIEERTFAGCENLTSITIPRSVTSIGQSAFRDCYKLSSIAIPDSVTTIEAWAFDETDWIDHQGDFVIVNNIFIKYQGKLGIVNIPNNVTCIGEAAFGRCRNLTSVTIPDSVTSIGYYAFHSCESLPDITIPNSVTSIGEQAFEYCRRLTSVTIPDSVTDIGAYAFRGCTGLTSVTFGNGVKNIGERAFEDCTGLPSVTIGNHVTTIGKRAFSGCSSITSITIPTSVTKIDDWALHCANLKDVYYAGTQEQWWAISVYGEGNKAYALSDATIHYNSPMPEQPAEPAAVTAQPTNDKLSVDGKDATPAAYKIGGANFFMLRDVAMLLNGTNAQFEISYDNDKKAINITTGKAYTPQGFELKTTPQPNAKAETSTDAVYIDGEKVELTAYKIGGANFYGIRDLGRALGFNVDWTSERGMFIETDKPYSGT